MNSNLYISYSWEGESESIVKSLIPQLDEQGITYKLDKKNIVLNGSITQFMQEIGDANHILVIIDEKYLRSEYCLYELFQIYIKSKTAKEIFLSKIHLIVLNDANLYDKKQLQRYETDWKLYVDGINEYLFPEFHQISVFLPQILKIISDAKVDAFTINVDSITKLSHILYQRLNRSIEIQNSEFLEILKTPNTTTYIHKLDEMNIAFPDSALITIAKAAIPLKQDINTYTQDQVDQQLLILNKITLLKNKITYKSAFALQLVYIVEYYEKWNLIFPKSVILQYDNNIKNSVLIKELFLGTKLSPKSKNVLRELHQNY